MIEPKQCVSGAVAIMVAAILVSCSGPKASGPPPRADDPIPIPRETSIISVPIEADERAIGRAIENAIPLTLWTVNKKVEKCIAPQKVKLFGRKINVTPAIGCTIVGVVTRGPIRLRGEGQEIVADVPITARISAKDIGGVLKGETATGSAMAHARIRLDLTADWQPKSTIALHYDWTTPPGIDFLGQRITFTDQANEKLTPVIRQLEKDLPRALAEANLRNRVEEFWKQSFTVISLNRDKPPVWMRVSPRKLIYGGYGMEKGRLRLNLGLEALTETFVGPEPVAPRPTPLPPLVKARTDSRFRFFIPVIADYQELELVILRALVKRSRRPFDLPGLGAVNVRFGKVEAYGTGGGRIVVGLTLVARLATGTSGDTRGMIWIAARPVNQAGSARIGFTDLSVTGDTDGVKGDLLLRLGNSPGISELIAEALEQNFAHDLDDLLGKVRRAIERKQEGDFTIDARIETVETGIIEAYGKGLYLPVRATGEAQISYRPVN